MLGQICIEGSNIASLFRVDLNLLLRFATTAYACAYEEERLLTSCASASPEPCVQVHLGMTVRRNLVSMHDALR